MKKTNEDYIYDVAELFKIFGDSTRIRILNFLLEKENNVSSIAESLNLSQTAVSHQLKILKINNLIKNRRDGKVIYYSLADEHVRDIISIGLEHIKEEK